MKFVTCAANFITKMKKIFTVLILLGSIQLNAQQYFSAQSQISPEDSIALSSYPELLLPEAYKGANAKSLPDVHDNSQFQYFRPIFNQYGWSCGQASTMGYNFTYEINRINNTNAGLEENQFPPAYTYNFFNKGADAIGVNYRYTLEAARANGNPNVTDYGGMGNSLSMWKSGYDIYYNGMKNRINNIYTIHVGDSAGLQVLKNWMYDHLEGSPYGGLANFYTDLGGYEYLPSGTPEEGSAVITSFGAYSGHSMTFLGWNDNIRWDYNNDGQYTNNIDINNDGLVNMKDWEIGGVILANSWGDGWADDGFCYVMYHVLAQEKADGGIWNKQVNVFDVKTGYEPTLTFKITLKHDSRDKIKVMAGISTDTSDLQPEHVIEFPVFNYSGGDYYMQGDNTSEVYKTLEFGLDVTPLLSYMTPGEQAKIFLQVKENDPDNLATGQVISFSLMDYSNGIEEIPCALSNLPIIENGTTTLSVIHQLNWNDVSIMNEEIPAFTPGETYTEQFTATGGTPDYKWSLITDYNEMTIAGEDPNISGSTIISGNTQNGFDTQQIDFDFPFYGSSSNQVTVHVDGFLMFDEIPYPLPYQVDDRLLFEHQKMIAPFLNSDIRFYSSNGDGIWYEGDDTHASFRWKGTVEVPGDDYYLDFTTTLFPDGSVEIYVTDFSNPEVLQRISGISSGDGYNFIYFDGSVIIPFEELPTIVYQPTGFPLDAAISEGGLLTAEPSDANKIYNIGVKVTDDNNIFAQKTFQLSSGLTYEYSITAGSNSQIDAGESVLVSFIVKNTGTETLDDVTLTADITNPYIALTDDSEAFGSIDPGQSVTVENAIAFDVDNTTPDNYTFALNLLFESMGGSWESMISFRSYAPSITLLSVIVDDGDNGRLDPGETADIIVPVFNSGQTLAEVVQGSVSTFDPYVTFNGTPTLDYGNIISGDIAYDSFSVTIDENTPAGHQAVFAVTINALPDIQVEQNFSLMIGRFPVFIVDMDPGMESGPVMFETLNDLDVLHDYDTELPENINSYQNLFICLGRKFSQHVLTSFEAGILQDFLEEGGNVYMEGGLTWYDDPQTVVHPMFSVGTEYLNWHDVDSVFGAAGTTLEPMAFAYDGSMSYYNYHVIPEGSAMVALTSQLGEFNFAVSNETETYKTIASTIDFSGLVDDVHPSTKKNLMAKILDFFGTEVVITDADEILADQVSSVDLQCYPNPAKNTTTISFNLANTGSVSIEIVDLQGNNVLTVDNSLQLQKGHHEIQINLTNLANGIYFGKLKTTNSVDLVKILKTN